MGKKNNYDKLGVMGKREADVRMAGQYGIDVSEYGNTGRPGENYNNKKTYDDLKKDVAKAAANDYDVRRSIEAAQLSGNKKAQKLGPINSASAAYDAHRFMKKMHGKHVGGGNYDGASDQAGVASYFVNKDRDKLIDSLTPKEKEAAEEAPVEQNKPEDLEPFEFEYSDKVEGAKDRIDKYETGIRSGQSIFNQDNVNPPVVNDQAAAADAFVDIYKADLLDAANLEENKAQNLNNALDVVGSYRSKFMN